MSYREWVQPGFLISELSSYYDAFCYTAATREVPDHVSVEAGFIGYLRLKEAYASACSDDEHAAVTAEAAQRFIDEHLQTLAAPLAKSLEHSGVRYLALAGSALLRRVGPRQDRLSGMNLPVLSESDESAFDCAET